MRGGGVRGENKGGGGEGGGGGGGGGGGFGSRSVILATIRGVVLFLATSRLAL